MSGLLSVLHPDASAAAGVDFGGEWSVAFPRQAGVKCLAVLSGQGWLVMEGVETPVFARTGDCLVLPHGRPFRVASDLALAPIVATTLHAASPDEGITPEGRLRSEIGPGQRTLHSDVRWRDLFAQAALPSVFEPRMAAWLRSHVPMCIAMESICAAGERRGGGADLAQSLAVARGLRASFAIVQALDQRLHPRSKRVPAASPVAGLAAMLWSVSRFRSFRTLLATGVRECRALIDVVARAASEASPPRRAAAATLLAAKPGDPD